MSGHKQDGRWGRQRMVRAVTAAAALLIATVGAGAGQAQAQTVDWTVDTAHTNVGFSVRHLGVSKVRGKFGKFDGKLQADKATGHLTGIEGTVDVTSIDTGIGKRDDHLKSPDFFDAAKFPQMKVKSKAVKFNGHKVTVVADLTIRDVTKEVTFTGEFHGKQKVDWGGGPQFNAGYSFTGKINRKEFGLAWNKIIEGTAVVADEVQIELELELWTKA